jgi:hypothetical protein
MMITTTGAYWRYPRFLPPSPNPAAAKGRRKAKQRVNRRERRMVHRWLSRVIAGAEAAE